MTDQNEKKEFMAAKYEFPYHYLPSATSDYWQISRHLGWGFEYLAYLSEVIRIVTDYSGDGPVLDVGCGDGRLANELAAHDIGSITGIDIDERAIALANAFKQDSNVTFQSGDITDLTEQDFEVATLIEVIEHIPDDDIEAFVSSIRDHMLPDGTLVISVPTVNVPVTKEHYRHYDLELLQFHLQPHFVIHSHIYIHKNSVLNKIISRLVSNRLFAMNTKLGLRLLTRLYRRFCAPANATNGAHLIAVAKPYRQSAG